MFRKTWKQLLEAKIHEMLTSIKLLETRKASKCVLDDTRKELKEAQEEIEVLKKKVDYLAGYQRLEWVSQPSSTYRKRRLMK